MKVDTIIIGGGISGLTCGIAAAQAGQRVAILSKGRGRIHYHSGSFDLLGNVDGEDVPHPLDAIERLPERHPYRRMGADAVSALADRAKSMLIEAGVGVEGSADANHYRLTPTGGIKPTWLTLSHIVRLDTIEQMRGKRVALMNIEGFIDFPAQFVQDRLRRLGLECDLHQFSIDQIDRRRNSSREMRSSSLAKVLAMPDALVSLAAKINSLAGDAERVYFPDIMGTTDGAAIGKLSRLLCKPVEFVATMPPSVPGERIHTLLRKRFVQLGGTFMIGGTVKRSVLTGDSVEGVYAKNLPDQLLKADNFVLATGSFMSGGIVAEPQRVVEPIFGGDVHVADEPEQWSQERLFDDQPFMRYGVAVDGNFHIMHGEQALANVYAIGTVLEACDTVRHACADGISMLTALRVADIITK